MSSAPIKIEDLRDLINQGQAKDPLVFLESVMNGQDPRGLSDIYRLVMEIQDFSDGAPSNHDWAEIVDLVISRYKYLTVSLNESTSAAKTLAEYLHAKKKTSEGNSGGPNSEHCSPLTEEEIELFKEKFNEEF